MQGLFFILIIQVTTLSTTILQSYLQNLSATLLTKTKPLITAIMVKLVYFIIKLTNRMIISKLFINWLKFNSALFYQISLKIIINLTKVNYLTISSKKMMGALVSK